MRSQLMNSKRVVHLVDDDSSILASTSAFLAARGCEVETYGSGAEFLETVTPGTDGCLVTDVRMTGMTGLELVERLKANKVSIPIIIITAHADIELAIRAMRHGVLDLLEKPFSNGALVKSIQDTLTRWNEGQGGPSPEAVNGRLGTLTVRE